MVARPRTTPTNRMTSFALALLTRGDTPLPAERMAPELAALLPDRTGIPKADTAPNAFELVETYTERGGVVRPYRARFSDRVILLAFAYDRSDRMYRVRAV